MAGPGGGPPRRSHTKSRKGCDTCKRRHIRCDESFPQCRNCTKHKIRCPYNDMPVPEDRATSPDKPDLMWTPETEADIEQWQRTGIFPFSNLNIYPAPSPQNYSVEELRLIHHVASICSELDSMDANNFTIWTRQMPIILQIGATHRYVMHALLAFSASHIAFLTDCPLVGNMAYEHRGIALKGLQDAINVFSRETSDAILAASLVLSWQATDWRSWTQLMQGTSSVIDAMEPWKHESQFGDFIAESSTFPTAPPSPTPDQKPAQPSKDDLDAYQRTLQQLQKVEAYLKQGKQDFKSIQQLITFLKGSRKVSPTLSIAQQFERLRPLRTWLFWLPVKHLKESGGSANSLIIIAHYYTVALLMERLFPTIGAAYFGSLSLGPVEDIARRLLALTNNGSHGAQTPLTLMEFPIDTVNEFRNRMGWISPARTPSFPQFDPPNFYAMDSPLPMPSVPGGPYMYGSPAFNYSTESLPMFKTEGPDGPGAHSPFNSPFNYSTESLPLLKAEPPTTNGGVSPLALTSPSFTNQQYLSIPSPSYTAGGLSPASSTFEGSFAYSDTEEYGSFDWSGYPPSGPMLGGSNDNFGVGMSTTPTFPPADNVTTPYRMPYNAVSSPCLVPELAGLVPLPESPLPYNDGYPGHRHLHHHSRTSSGISFIEPSDVKSERPE